MPIYSVGNEGNKEVIFGNGDIKVSGGWMNNNKSIGILTLHEGEVKEIGHLDLHEPHMQSGAGDKPVRMIFDKAESIDVVIRHLEKVKEYMNSAEKARNPHDT